ncbi:MAG: phosphate/phosphite/phosphonate ABC transporter substrate-binding protein [Candidatus Kapabacteria bacterium]|jgi:phosphonate transport system substrate-binding protein|nr:phosphate/phosphite/phosphonate ABC transporter substrate-binding protein [Candidatus Kapabacteria bacterium]
MKYAKFYLPLLAVILIKLSFSQFFAEDAEFGSPQKPIRIALVPSQEAGKVINSTGKLIDVLKQKTGFSFTIYTPSNYIVAVEAFGTNKADIGFLNTFSYILANSKYGAEAVLKIVRRNGDTTYGGQFLTHVDSGIDSISQLHGKRIAFVDPASASGYILPKALLQAGKIVPAQEVFAQRHDNVVMMIYQKQVDAGAAYYSDPDRKTGEIQDAVALVLKQYPDAKTKLKNIGFTERIANDPVMFRKDFPREMREKIVSALVEYANSAEGKKTMSGMYGIEGLLPCRNEDYQSLRQMLKEQGMDVEELVKKTKK